MARPLSSNRRRRRIGETLGPGPDGGAPERGARSPGAHVLIAMIASAAHALADNPVRGVFWAANVRERNPSLTREDFFRAFPTRSSTMRQRVLRALAQVGFA